jgi:subtilisin family serine protease
MATFRIGGAVLTYTVIGAGLRNGWLPPPLEGPRDWGELGPEELNDLEAFEAAGWRFHQQPDLAWEAAEEMNGGSIQAGLLATHPLGGLVILRNHLVVSLSEGTPPLTESDDFITKVPLDRNVYDVRLRLPPSNLEQALVQRIVVFEDDVKRHHQSVVVEPLILYNLQNAGRIYRVGTATSFSVALDPLIQNHWNKIDITDAWSVGSKGSGLRVAVIDKGFNPTDLQIKGNVKETAFVNDHGVRVVNAAIPPDDHGTLCAGLVAALLDGQSVNGAAPECSLMLVAVESGTSALAVAKAIELCASGIDGNPGADVICTSLGITTHPWEGSTEVRNAIDAAYTTGRGGTRGTLIVWADFDASDPIPASSVEGHPRVLCVGQSDSSDTRVSCGFGPGLALVAPGVNVVGITGTKSGSSCAAPQVAGVAALILAKRPNLKSSEVAKVITDNCHRPAHPNTRSDTDDGWGRLDAKAAVENA